MKKQIWNEGWAFCSDIDTSPKTVDLPHDAMQTEDRVPGLRNGSGTGYYPGGKYTYTKVLTLTEEEAAKTIRLEFEGVYMRSTVLLNGEPVGGRYYGYSDFFVDLTGKVMPGDNEIKVIADNSFFPNSRWYSGAGIYRDVWLHTADGEYIESDGIRVTAVSYEPVVLRIETDAVIAEGTKICAEVRKEGALIAEAEGNDVTVRIDNPVFWSDEDPALYDIIVSLKYGESVIDEETAEFGIRKIAFVPRKGLFVNDVPVKLRGGSVHHDHAFLGTEEYDAACIRKMKIMKEAGFNAVRIAHHPASKSMLRACDRLGLYVVNETFDTWHGSKSMYDYAGWFEDEWEKDLTDMIRVSYNHPSVILYSIGNEVYTKEIGTAVEITERLAGACRKLDPTRGVINAINPLTTIMGDDKELGSGRDTISDPREAAPSSGLVGSQLANTLVTMMPFIMRVMGNERAMRKRNGMMEPLDVTGLNYASYLYEKQHVDFPDRLMCGTESYPRAIGKNWPFVNKHPYMIGDFVWTAWDYLGEAGVGTVGYGKAEDFTQPFPTIAGGCANIDLTGEINCQGMYTKIVYGQEKRPYIAVHPVDHAGEKVFTGQWRMTDAVHSWSWHGCGEKKVKVDVYSSSPVVELFQDGESLGKKAVREYMAVYEVTYRDGELRAVGYGPDGRTVGEDILRTALGNAKLRVAPEKTRISAGGRDLLYIPVEITDNDGNRFMRGDREITVRVEGAAELAGLGSASLTQTSLRPYTGNTIRTFEGRALAILRSGKEAGPVTVTVSCDGLESAVCVTEAI